MPEQTMPDETPEEPQEPQDGPPALPSYLNPPAPPPSRSQDGYSPPTGA